MSYFTNLPKTVIDFSKYGEEPKLYLVTDIITNVRVKMDLLKNIVYYDEYDIRDGDTPEIISELFYNTPQYHWIVMLINERFDYINDFPMTQSALEAFIQQKYGDNLYDIHHYETSEGYVVNSDYVNPQGQADALPVTNYEYEVGINESKRSIKMIPPNILGEVLSQFREILK
jgi:hypothetical protein